jgi:hypothetical protein
MRTHVEFESTHFPADADEDELVNPGVYGKKLAEFVAAGLAAHNLKVRTVFAEDWGWTVELENKEFPLWIGCANYEEFENGFLCFIEPSKPVVRKWFSKVDTTPTVESVAVALGSILRGSGKTSRLRWWDDSEVRR